MTMYGMEDLTGAISGNKPTRTPQSNAVDALRLSKEFLSILANDGFFSGSPTRGLTPELAYKLSIGLVDFGKKNPVMATPVGDLCLPHIEGFIDTFFVAQSAKQEKACPFDVLIQIKKYQGGVS